MANMPNMANMTNMVDMANTANMADMPNIPAWPTWPHHCEERQCCTAIRLPSVSLGNILAHTCLPYCVLTLPLILSDFAIL